MKVLFVAGFGAIVRDMQSSLRFYRDAIGIPLVEGEDVATEALDGVKYFSLWPLADAAESCFGEREWPSNVGVPQALDRVRRGRRRRSGRGASRLLVG